jgi:hypothetical protein
MNALNQLRAVAQLGAGWRFENAEEQSAAKLVIVS